MIKKKFHHFNNYSAYFMNTELNIDAENGGSED